MDYIDSNVADRFISEGNRGRCPKGPRGPIAPVPCDYCQHSKPLIEFGKPSDDDYLEFGLISKDCYRSGWTLWVL